LNTAFEAMRKLKFRDPVIEQLDGSVKITLRHEKLASPEEIICEYLRSNAEINNSKARDITFIGSENSVKRIFNKMLKSNIIERIPDRPQAKTGYRKGTNFPSLPSARRMGWAQLTYATYAASACGTRRAISAPLVTWNYATRIHRRLR
jgi:hypothetical protein